MRSKKKKGRPPLLYDALTEPVRARPACVQTMTTKNTRFLSFTLCERIFHRV